MILYSNGCSYTWGGTLYEFDSPHSPPTDGFEISPFKTRGVSEEERLENVYPHHLGKLLGATTVINEGLGCGSNARIVRKTLNYFNNKILNGEDIKDHFVTIQWTDLARTEFYHSGGGWFQFMHNGGFVTEEGCTEYVDAEKWITNYYKNFGSDNKDLALFFEQVYSLGFFFQFHKIPYVFFSHAPIIYSFFDDLTKKLPFVEKQVQKLLNHFIWYGGDCMEAFIHTKVDNCLPIGTHPSKLGHKQWADMLYKFIIEKDLLNNG